MVSLPALNDTASVFTNGYRVTIAIAIISIPFNVWKTIGSSRDLLIPISSPPYINRSSPSRLEIEFAAKISVILTTVLKIPAAVASE
ncbi:hypothetical protein D3C76_1315370 [compost metagenome]